MKNTIALTLAIVLLVFPPAMAKTADSGFARQEEKIAAAKEEVGALENRIKAAEETYARLDKVYGKAVSRLGAAKSDAGKVRGKIRKLDIKLARMRQVGPLAEAWAKYKQNPTEAQFVDLWTYVKGTPPDNATRSQYTVMATVLHKEILNKGVTGVALALVEIGKLTMTLVEVLSGEAFKEPAGQVADFLKEYVVDKALEATGAADIFGASTVVKTAAGLSDASGALGELEDQAQAMADEAYENAKNALHGLKKGQDLTTEIKKAKAARKVAEALLKKKELALAPIQEAVDITKKNLAGARKKIDAWKVEKEALSAKQRDLEEKLADDKILAAQQEALEKLNAGRDNSQVGKPYATGLRMSIGQTNLAADALTAQITGYPRTTRVRAEAVMGVIKKSPFNYTVKLSKGKTATRQTIRQVCSSAGRVVNLPDIRLAGFPGVRVENRTFKLEGKSAGAGRITARVKGGESRSVQRKIGDTKFADCRKASKQYTSSPVRMAVWKADAVDYTGLSDRERKTGVIDFFVDAGRNVRTRPKVTVTNGSETQVFDHASRQLLGAKIRGHRFPVIIDDSGFRIDWPSTPGQATVTLRVGVPGDASNGLEKQFKLRASRLEAGLVPVGVALRQGRVPLDKPVTCRVSAIGEVDMSPYQVQWSGFESGVDHQATTGFKKLDGQWVSDNVIVYRSSGLDLGSNLFDAQQRLDDLGMRVQARVVEKGSKIPVGRFMDLPPLRPVPPPLERVRIQPGKKTATRVSQVDFFQPDDRSRRNLRIAVMGYFAGGLRMWIPVDYMENEWQGELAAAGIGFDAREGLEIHSESARFGEVGSAVLEVGLDQHAANRRNLFLARNEVDDRLTFTNNLIQVVQGGTAGAPTLEARVYGPANLASCKARWHFFGSIKKTSDFARQDDYWVSKLPAGGLQVARRLLAVDLAAGERTIATYRCSKSGRPMPAVKMGIQMAEAARPGEKVILTATIDNLTAGNADEYICRWRVDKKFGELMKTETAVFAAGASQAKSRTTLFLNEDFPGRMPVSVEAELFLKIGAGKVE